MITPEYPAKIHVRSKLHYFPLIKDRINEARRSLFRTTCFGPWLDISYVENDDGMIHYVLQKQSFSDDESFDLPFIYHLNGHSLHFGRRQFCLVTGFKFGLISLREHRNGDIPFRNRLFPKKIGYDVKIIDVLAFIEDEEKFSKLVSVVDDAFFRIVNYLDAWNSFPWGEHIWRQLYDSIRNVCSKHKLEHLDGLRKNPNHVPSYTLSGFLFCFQDMESNWSISLNVLSGSISLSFLTRSPPVSIGGLYGEYLNKRSALPAKKQKEIDESKREYDLSGRDMTLKGKCFEKEERFKKFSPKNEDLLHSTSEDEPNNKDDISPKKDVGDVYCCDVNSDVSQCFIPANILVEKGDCECKSVKPWIEDLSRPFKRIDRIYLSRDLEQWLSRSDVGRCKFPWCNDISVDSSFWRGLCGLDDHRKGWLVDEHIDLWVMYMWHTREFDMDWAVVSCYFLALLLQGSLPKFYANNDLYPVAWSDVERVFIPINESQRHWSLAMFHICSGIVTFYDSEITHDEEFHTWYLNMRECLAAKIPVILRETGVFEKKNIDPAKYNISFRHADHVPKQGGVFGDCGVFLCMFLYRLAHGVPLAVDDPVQAALAYREKMIRFYFQHKMFCP
ncbi:phospholipase-like protein [Tanacetum coccineum]